MPAQNSRRNSKDQDHGSLPPPYSESISQITADPPPPPPIQKPVYLHDVERRPYVPYQVTDDYTYSQKEIHYYPDRTIIVEKPVFDFYNRRRRQNSGSSSDESGSCQCSLCGLPLTGRRRKHCCNGNRPATTYRRDSASQRRLNSWLNIGTFGCFAGLAALFGYIWSSRLDEDEEAVIADEEIG